MQKYCISFWKKGWILCFRSETQCLPNIRSISLHTHFHKHTHTQHHQGPVMEEKETHFSLVNIKSWMCHSVLSGVLYVASPRRCLHYSCLSSVPRQPEWSGGHHLHNVSSHLGTKTVIANLAICILWESTPLAPAGRHAGRFPDAEEHTLLYNTAAQHSGSPAKNTVHQLHFCINWCI